MEVFDGTRKITRKEIDHEFDGCWVLVRTENTWDWYLMAATGGSDEEEEELWQYQQSLGREDLTRAFGYKERYHGLFVRG